LAPPFTGVISSLVNDVFNPLLGRQQAALIFSNVFVSFNGQPYGNRNPARQQRDHPVPDRELRRVLVGEGPDQAERTTGRRCCPLQTKGPVGREIRDLFKAKPQNQA